MSPELQIPPAAQFSRRELLPYDEVARSDPEAKARERVKREESHPFLHYLGQALANHLLPLSPPELPKGESTGLDRAGTVGLIGTPRGGKLLGQERLLEAIDTTSWQLPASPLPLDNQVAANNQASEESTPPTNTVTPDLLPRLIFSQVQRMVQHGEPATRLQVELHPEQLGKLALAFTYAQHKVSVNVIVFTPQTKDLLEGQLGTIRSLLEAHQLPAGELKITVNQGNRNGRPAERDLTEFLGRQHRRRRSALNAENLAIE